MKKGRAVNKEIKRALHGNITEIWTWNETEDLVSRQWI